MTSYDYLIAGAGVAAASAVKGIRAVDREGSIGILGAEPDPPVYRPDLSKDLWLKDDKSLEDSVLLGDETGLELRTGVEVRSVDTAGHRVVLADGSEVGYGRLLLATGAEPITLDVESGPRVIYYRTAADYRALSEVATKDAHVLVIGGGYIGSEIASALSQKDVRVTMILVDDLVQQHMFPKGLAQHVTDAFGDHDVELVHGMVESGTVDGDSVTLRLEDGTELTGDAVVIGVGVRPRTKLAEEAGLQVEGGIVVDDRLRTSADGVYAAGDVASYPDARLGRRRVEHVDNAEKSGEVAGRNMAGEETAYTHTPFFWSDLYDDGYEAIGELKADLETVEDFADDDYGKGVVYYVDKGRVRGVLLWNVWDSVGQAQELIEQTAQQPLDDASSLKGRIALG
jgi:NADPH-dependent 2,4-dienoyl-CoA reductase/sulfur reductase-like enzyme